MLHMTVVNQEGQKIGLSRSATRNLLRIVDGLPAFNILGMVLIGSSPRGQRFGDRVAKTYVVDLRGYQVVRKNSKLKNSHSQ